MTAAFMMLIHDRAARDGDTPTWEEFASTNRDLLAWKPSILDRYYQPETLASDRARTTFVWPDRV